MSDTPRTEGMYNRYSDDSEGYYAMLSHARQLERDLNEAVAALEYASWAICSSNGADMRGHPSLKQMTDFLAKHRSQK